jgi:hypothetical protein
MLINPVAYKLCSSICGGLAILPLDIVQTNMMSTEKAEFKVDEFKWMLLMPMVFVLQNTAYTRSVGLNNQVARGIIAGIVASPMYIFLQIKKLKSRFNLMPNMKEFIFWMTLRQMVVYTSLYSIFTVNIPYAKFVAGITANMLGFPLKLICMSRSYPIIKVDMNTAKKTGMLEIIKSGFGDGITLYLIYGFKYSPVKL